MFNTELKLQKRHMTNNIYKTSWIHCPICGNKTRTKVKEDTIILNFPLFCPKCKREIIIDVVKLKMVVKE